MLTAATGIKAVTSAELNEVAGQVVREIRTYIKSVEAMRQTLTKPLLDGQRLLKSLADDHLAPLIEQQKRIEKLATNFLESEQRRVEAEERERRESFLKAEQERIALEEKARNGSTLLERMTAQRKATFAESQVQAIIAAPEPEMQRAKGQTMKQVLRYEVLDIHAVYKARPELCNLEIKPAAVRATCFPEMPVPGLKLYWENQSVFTSR